MAGTQHRPYARATILWPELGPEGILCYTSTGEGGE
jgi:hypothetical protein